MCLMPRLSFTLDGFRAEGFEGQTLLEAIRPIMNIPTLCEDPVLAPGRGCRLCQVETPDGLVLACETPLAEGMAILTHSRIVRQARVEALSDIVREHGGDCLFCERSHNCKLQSLCHELHLSSLGAAARAPRLTLVGAGAALPIQRPEAMAADLFLVRPSRPTSEERLSRQKDFDDKAMRKARFLALLKQIK